MTRGRGWVACVLAVIAGAAAVAVRAPASGWGTVVGPPELSFPRDHGAHPEYRTEWWYLTALLEDAEGERYGVQFTLFRQGLDSSEPRPGESALRARQAVAGNLVVAEVERGRIRSAERLRRAAAGLAGCKTDRLEVWIEDWWLRLDRGGVVRLVAGDPGAGIGVELALAPTGPLVRHGRGGYSRKGDDPGNASVYLTWTDLEVSGTLTLDGRQRSVSGSAWYDHEWGTSQLGRGVVGWDWFGIRFDDGRALMVYRLRRQDGSLDPHSSGTLVAADGGVIGLAPGDFELEALESWKSRHTGAVYPSRWRLRLPGHGLDLEVVPEVLDCEIDSSFSTGTIYWEGPVEVTGTASGEGYAELTGYAGSLAGRF